MAFALALLTVPLSASTVQARLAVIASIGPVHSIVANVMQGLGSPRLLVPGGASEHTYVLRPSEAEALARADVIVRVDPALETFLAKPLEALAGGGRVITLSQVAGIVLLDRREDAQFEAHEEAHEHDAAGSGTSGSGTGGGHSMAGAGGAGENTGGESDAGYGRRDLHLWLDPRNAAAMAREVARVLGEADPAQAGIYLANAERFAASLVSLETEIGATLAPLEGKPFVVFHDAYQYFERRFGIRAAGSVTLAPGLQPGARHLSRLRERIGRLGVKCVFSEPQFKPKLAQMLIEGTGARSGTLDPLGATLEPGPAAYGLLLRNLAASFAACLSR